LLATVIAAGLASAIGAPDATPKDESLVLSKIDTDHDGSVSLAEAKASATAKFDALDTVKEGTLDVNELTGILSPNAVKKAKKPIKTRTKLSTKLNFWRWSRKCLKRPTRITMKRSTQPNSRPIKAARSCHFWRIDRFPSRPRASW
jgi:hypothetical protein